VHKWIALFLSIVVAACSGDGAGPDTGAAPDKGSPGEAGPAQDGGGAQVKNVILLGVTPDKDFASNGTVTFTVLPTAADGSAMIDKSLAFAVAAASPSGLTPKVETKEEKRPASGQPLITGLLFDSSGSMSTNDPSRLRVEAGRQFIDQLEADDQVAVADFGAGSTIGFKATRILQNFTTDKAKAKLAMAMVAASGDTPMFESVSEVLVAFNLKFPAASYPNRALVVLGDGEPNGTGTLLGSCTVAKTTQVPVSTVGFGPAAYQSLQADLAAIWNLGALSGCSGGTYSSVARALDLSKTYVAIGQLLKKGSMVITVTYSPIPTKTFVSGTMGVGNGTQTPVEVKYTFYAP
jgi:hypothetical protein